jgi:hypothetical protein
MKTIRPLAPYRVLITRIVLIYFLTSLLWRGYSYLLPYQLKDPVFTKINYDPSFWILRYSGFQNLLVNNAWGSFIFSILLILICCYCIIYPRKIISIIIFSIMIYIYGVLFNLNLTHSTHLLAGMTIITFCFWSEKDENFEILWDFARYYTCWLYSSAFLWKIINGSIFQSNHGYEVFKRNLSWYIFQNENLLTRFYKEFLMAPDILNIGAKVIFLIEGIFIIGFFTKKYDNILILSIIIIHLSTYLFVDVLFFELGILIFSLFNKNLLEFLSKKSPILNQ